MSYRALVSIINLADNGDQLHVADFKLLLDEDLKNGEKVAHELADKRDRLEAFMAAHATPELRGVCFTPEARASWLRDYADQTWEISFQPSGDYVRVQITGKDSGGTLIFFRSTVYHVG